jgi:hypothetical protein
MVCLTRLLYACFVLLHQATSGVLWLVRRDEEDGLVLRRREASRATPARWRGPISGTRVGMVRAGVVRCRRRRRDHADLASERRLLFMPCEN